ncbi:MAG: hypothetical protein ACPKOI_09220 [Pleomorphochaeta sp.]
MKKVLTFILSVSFFVVVMSGCSTLTQEDQRMITDVDSMYLT